jgi:hypothetical protein
MRETLKSLNRYALAMTLALMVSGCAPVLAQGLEPQTVLPPSVEGNWVRTDTLGSQSFDGLTKSFTPAELTPKGKEYLANMRGGRGRPAEVRTATGVVVTNPTPCIYNGSQLRMEYDSEGFIATKNKTMVMFTVDRGGDRYVYLDKKAIPDASLRAPSSSGYSIGHIEPDGTLVVTTGDMTPGPVTAGGYRTPKTIVEQRYIPDPDGKRLKIVFTWNDPEIYAKPHTYTYTFERLPKGSVSLDEFCDATNPLEGQSVAPPPQK